MTSLQRSQRQARDYYDVLRRITNYMRSEQVLNSAEKGYGLEALEALEYAYDNIRGEAVNALRKKRRPIVKEC